MARRRLPRWTWIAAVAALLFLVVMVRYRSALGTPMDPNDLTLRDFAVKQGTTSAAVARDLEERAFVPSAFFVQAYVALHGLDTEFKAGTFRISRSMTPRQIVAKLTDKAPSEKVTLVEGATVRDLAELLEERGIAAAESVVACVKSCAFEHAFLAEKPRGVDLEGYLFPDTYALHAGMGVPEILDVFLTNFGRRVNEERRAKAKAMDHTLHEVITMASLIEREVTETEDRKIVSGILWRRLELGIPLGVDASTLYAVGKRGSHPTAEDLQSDSPYNTRKRKGMPPGPINNPGLDAIDAALDPTDTEYLFYLTDENGAVHYARTNAEHEANKDRYL